jgi:hypothetical protein
VWSKQKQGRQSAGETAAELNSSSMQMSADGLTTTMQSGTAKVEPCEKKNKLNIYVFLV